MASIHTIPMHLGDLITDTMHLTAAEFGGYIRLLAAHYRMGRDGLPNDDMQLRRITGLDGKTWSTARSTILNYFELEGDSKWVHRRVQTTLSDIAGVQEQNRAKALKRWESPHAAALPQQSNGNATAMPSRSQKPEARSQKQVIPPYPPEFERFWSTYPPNGAGKIAAHQSYAKAITNGASHADIHEGAEHYRNYVESRSDGRQFTAHATTWLNQGRWVARFESESAFDRLRRELDTAASEGGDGHLVAIDGGVR